MHRSILALTALVAPATLAVADSALAAAQLFARDTSDPHFIGYIDAASNQSTSCAASHTISTSGSYVQCCSTSGKCPFYTACSSNTLLASGVSGVPCDASGLCNTALVKPTLGPDSSSKSYLTCWPSSIGTREFPIIQTLGSATSTAASAGSSPTTSAASATGKAPAQQTTSAADRHAWPAVGIMVVMAVTVAGLSL